VPSRQPPAGASWRIPATLSSQPKGGDARVSPADAGIAANNAMRLRRGLSAGLAAGFLLFIVAFLFFTADPRRPVEQS
jgi:hypothetical protein